MNMSEQTLKLEEGDEFLIGCQMSHCDDPKFPFQVSLSVMFKAAPLLPPIPLVKRYFDEVESAGLWTTDAVQILEENQEWMNLSKGEMDTWMGWALPPDDREREFFH